MDDVLRVMVGYLLCYTVALVRVRLIEIYVRRRLTLIQRAQVYAPLWRVRVEGQKISGRDILLMCLDLRKWRYKAFFPQDTMGIKIDKNGK